MGLEQSKNGRRFLRKKEIQAVHRRILACALNCVTYAEAAGCEDRTQAVILAAYEPPLFAMIRELASWQKRLAELLDADDLAIWETYEAERAELRDLLHPAAAGGVRAARLGELWEQAPRDLLFSDPDDLEEDE